MNVVRSRHIFRYLTTAHWLRSAFGANLQHTLDEEHRCQRQQQEYASLSHRRTKITTAGFQHDACRKHPSLSSDVPAHHENRTDLGYGTSKAQRDAVQHPAPDQTDFDAKPLPGVEAQQIEGFTVVTRDRIKRRPRPSPNEGQHQQGLSQHHRWNGEEQIKRRERSTVGQHQVDQDPDHHRRQAVQRPYHHAQTAQSTTSSAARPQRNPNERGEQGRRTAREESGRHDGCHGCP